MGKFFITIISIILGFILVWGLITATSIPKPGQLEADAHKVFDMINQERQEAGITPLVWDDDIATLAKKHSEFMSETRQYEHSGLLYAENLMAGREPEAVYKAWDESQLHALNMINQKLSRGAVGMGVKLNTVTILSQTITVSTGQAYTTFMAE